MSDLHFLVGKPKFLQGNIIKFCLIPMQIRPIYEKILRDDHHPQQAKFPVIL